MNREVNTPNIVVDDNYRMLVKRLTRRYAERGASVYTDADAIEQERSDARARAIAPDAYRISRAMGDNPEMYKSGDASGSRYMTTDDYLVYFSKCHDTFDAVNYYNLHAEAPVVEELETIKPRVLVNRKRLEMAQKSAAVGAASARKRRPASRAEQQETGFSLLGKKTATAFVAVAASLAIFVGGAFAFLPGREASDPEAFSDNAPVAAVNEGQEILQNRE